jgi:hypothetical protein
MTIVSLGRTACNAFSMGIPRTPDGCRIAKCDSRQPSTNHPLVRVAFSAKRPSSTRRTPLGNTRISMISPASSSRK